MAANGMEIESIDDQGVEFRRSLRECWTSEMLCDVVLTSKIDAKRIPAHRIVLAASCGYFQAMFAGEMRESHEKEITLDMPGNALQVLVKYFYTDKIELHESHAKEVFAAAHMWQLDKVAKKCFDFLLRNLNANNCFDILFFAESNAYDVLLEKTERFVHNEFETMSQGNSFLNVNFDYLLNLIQQDSLNAHNEEVIFRAIERWINHDESKREVCKDALIKHVRLQTLHPQFLYDFVKPFCNTTKTREAYYNAIEYHCVPSRREKISSIIDCPRVGSSTLLAVISRPSKKNYLDIEAFCASTKKWHELKISVPWLDEFNLVKMDDQLIILGVKDNKSMVKAISVDMKTLHWKYMKQINHKLYVTACNGVLYGFAGTPSVANSYNTERWDPSTNKWIDLKLPSSLEVRQATVLDDKIYTLSWPNTESLVIQCFCPKEHVWTTLRTIEVLNINDACLTAHNELLHIFVYGENFKCFSFDTKAQMLTEVPSMNFGARPLHSLTSFQNEIIAAYRDKHLLKFNPVTKVWTQLPSCNNYFVRGVVNVSQFNWCNSKIIK